MSIFKDSQGKPVMKSVFIWEIWDAHTSMGLPANKIPSHRQACQPSYSKNLETGLSGGWGSTRIACKPHPLQEDRRFRVRNSINTSLCRLHNLGMHSLVSWTRNPLLRKAKFGDRFQHQATFFVRWSKEIGVTSIIRIAFVDIHMAKWTPREISLCGRETMRLALKSWDSR